MSSHNFITERLRKLLIFLFYLVAFNRIQIVRIHFFIVRLITYEDFQFARIHNKKNSILILNAS